MKNSYDGFFDSDVSADGETVYISLPNSSRTATIFRSMLSPFLSPRRRSLERTEEREGLVAAPPRLRPPSFIQGPETSLCRSLARA